MELFTKPLMSDASKIPYAKILSLFHVPWQELPVEDRGAVQTMISYLVLATLGGRSRTEIRREIPRWSIRVRTQR